MGKPDTATTITVAKATAEHPRQSEGAITERSDGSLLLVWQEYVASELGGEDNAPNHLAAMVSRDEGRTWGEHRVLFEPAPDMMNLYSPSFIRPSRDAAGDELLMFYFAYHTLEAGQPPSSSGFIVRSQDGGETFTSPMPVWTRRPYGSASSSVKRLSTGRIVVPFAQQAGGIWGASDHIVGGFLLSDDGGATWQQSESRLELPMRGVMEVHVEERLDGRLMAVMRTQLGAVFQAFSTDGGLTWSRPQTTGLKAPESCPEIVRIPQTNDLLIVWNDGEYDPQWGSHYGARTPLTVAVSRDEGQTWVNRRNIETDPRAAFTNPGCAFTSAGKVLINYWTCRYTADNLMAVDRIDLKLAVFDVDWLYE